MVAAWTGTIWPTSESGVTSSSMVRWAEVKVSARMDAASALVAATGSVSRTES